MQPHYCHVPRGTINECVIARTDGRVSQPALAAITIERTAPNDELQREHSWNGPEGNENLAQLHPLSGSMLGLADDVHYLSAAVCAFPRYRHRA